jgi:outer membrane protein assembly factor BamD (BamD/ComL family)
MSRMSQKKRGHSPETLLVFVGILVFLAGCASTPKPAATPLQPTPPPVQQQYPVTGQQQYPAPAQQQYPQYQAPGQQQYPAPGQTQYPAPGQPQYPQYPAPGQAQYPGAAPGMTPQQGPGPALVQPGYAPNPYGSPTASNAAPAGDPGVVPYGATGVAPASFQTNPPPAMNAPPPGGPQGPPTYGPPTPVITTPTAAADKPKSDDDGGFDWGDLAPDVMWKNMKKSMGYGPDEKIAREQFQQAEALFHEKKYVEAADKFYIASWRWPDSTLEEDSMFLMGESYFFADQYGKSQDAYDMLLKAHGNTRYLDTVMSRMFAIGRYWEQLEAIHPHWPLTPNFSDKTQPWFDTWGNAIAAYESIHMHDPRGPLADSAVMAAANAYFRAGHYADAAMNYDVVRKDYPKSKFQMEAHLLGLKSKMMVYQGPLYDAGALKDASTIADQTRTQFRGRLGDEERFVEDTRSKIVVDRAEREWAVAQFYEQKKYFGAARKYYAYILEKYPQTPFAEKARQRIEQIKNEPDVPPNYFKWLSTIFDHER